MTDEGASASSESRAGFWSFVVGLPAALSVLRLWVESGGDLQITLLLVSNVSPLNLGAALFATTTQLATVVLVALFSAGGIVGSAVRAAPAHSRLRLHPPPIARIFAATPPWFIAAVFVLAVLTWRIVYLPMLVPAAVAAAQRPPWRLHDRPLVAAGFYLAALAGYGWLIGPTTGQAWAQAEYSVVLLLVAPPLVALGICGPIPGWFARLFSSVALLAIGGIAAVVFQSVVQTPILPLVVIETTNPADLSGFLRGHIISVDDVNVVLLQDLGGVRYLKVDDVRSTVLCGTPEELPRLDLFLRGYHVEDSLLTAIGRQVRPRVRVDPLCRIATPAST